MVFGLAASVVLLSNCGNEDEGLPAGDPTVQLSSVRIAFLADPALTANPEYALVDVQNGQGESVCTDKKLLIAASGAGFVTESLELVEGHYSLSKFIIFDENDHVVLATPVAASDRSEGLADLVPISLELMGGQTLTASADILPVSQGNDAVKFGYPDGAFGIDGSNEYVPLRFRAQMWIGDALYDHLDATLKVIAWNDAGDSWSAERTMERVTTITVPTGYEHHQVEWVKWGSRFELRLTKDELFRDEEILLSATRQAKRLSSETEYILKPEGYELERKTAYSYSADGKLETATFHQKLAGSNELSPYMVAKYEYLNGRLHKISRTVDGQAYDEQLYHYMGDGRLKAIDLSGPAGDQIAEWLYDPITGAFEGVQYNFDNGSYFIYYYNFESGNLVKEQYAGGNTGGGGSSDIAYDKFINPYYQFNITDYFLRFSSKNNVNGKISSYSGSFPSFVPKTYSYVYDTDGYPVEREVLYEAYGSNAVSYYSKIIFEYQ